MEGCFECSICDGLTLNLAEIARGHFELGFYHREGVGKIIPDFLASEMDRRIEEKQAHAEANGEYLYNEELVGVYNLQESGYLVPDGTGFEPGFRYQRSFDISTYTTNYLHFCSTNLSLDEVMEDESTLRQRYGEDPREFNVPLANAVGVCGVPVTTDNKCLIVRRGSRVGSFQGCYGISPSGLMSSSDFFNNQPNPVVTINREAKEELGLECRMEFKPNLLARLYQTMSLEVGGVVELPIDSTELEQTVESWEKLEEEAEEYIIVGFSPEDILTDEFFPDKRWCPSHAAVLLTALENEYGRNCLESRVEEL